MVVHCRLAAVPPIDTRVVIKPVPIGEPRRISSCNPEATAKTEGFLHREKRILSSPVTPKGQHHSAFSM